MKLTLILLFSCIFSLSAHADKWHCDTAISYIPPATERHPHIVKVGQKVNAVIWSSVIPEIEQNPWDLIQKTVCLKGPTRFYESKPEIIIREKDQIKVVIPGKPFPG